MRISAQSCANQCAGRFFPRLQDGESTVVGSIPQAGKPVIPELVGWFRLACDLARCLSDLIGVDPPVIVGAEFVERNSRLW
jgi:hypothetical protein